MPIGIPIVNSPTIKTINSSIGLIPNIAHLWWLLFRFPYYPQADEFIILHKTSICRDVSPSDSGSIVA